MKKFIIPVIALLFVAVTANANPRLKNQKHFGKDFDPNQKVEIPMATLAELNKGPQFKNNGHVQGEGALVDVNNANTVTGPKFKNERVYNVENAAPQAEVRPEIAAK